MGMQRFIAGSNTYSFPVFIGTNVLEEIVLSLVSMSSGKKLFIVSDQNLYAPYASKIVAQLRARGCDVRGLNVVARESNKTLEQVSKILLEMIRFNCPTSTVMVGIGGGFICDLVGFIAAHYRGSLPYINIATTFASMTTSAITGYHSVNANGYKDQLSVMHYPSAVFADLSFIQTLPQSAISEGILEIIKHAIIYDEALFNYLLSNAPLIKGMDPLVLTRLISRCVEIRTIFMKADEQGNKAQLNLELGNTIGHALETYTGFQLSHGNASSVGTLVACRVARDMGMLSVSEYGQIKGLIESFGLPVVIGSCDHGRIVDAIYHDRKYEGSYLKYILPEKIGRTAINERITIDLIDRVLEER